MAAAATIQQRLAALKAEVAELRWRAGYETLPGDAIWDRAYPGRGCGRGHLRGLSCPRSVLCPAGAEREAVRDLERRQPRDRAAAVGRRCRRIRMSARKGAIEPMTDRIARDPHPGLVDRLAEALLPWLFSPSQAAIDRQRELKEPGPEAGL